MLTTKEVRGVRVCRPLKPGKELTKDGVPRHRRKIGKVYKTVFSPDGLRVVGFQVRRPDLLWMFKRPERFLALDAMDVQDGFIVPSKGSSSWDQAAVKRLDVDWDKCILWEGIEVRTKDGRDLGYVDEISFDERTGELNSLFLDDGGTARALVGSVEIPVELMVGYKKGILIVQPEAADLLPTGGLAGKAGEATARIGYEAKEGAQKAGQAVGKAASTAVDAGSKGLGKALGRMKRSVTGAVDGYREASGANERAAEKKAAAEKAAAAEKKAAAKPKATSAAAKPAGTAASKPKATSSSSAKPSSAAKSSSTTKSSSSSSSKSSSTGKAVANHMKAAGSMFSDFKKEFDKAKK